jgi:hypothetical protein
VVMALPACGGSSSTANSSAHGTGGAPASTTSSSPSATSTSPSAHATGSVSSSATTADTAPAGAAAISGCPTSTLHLSFVSGQGAGGTAYLTYALTNVGRQTCTLFGYPGVSILNAAGHIVQHPAQRGGIQAPNRVRLVTLAGGRQARFIVTSSDVIPSPGCTHAFTGTTLQVFPPNQRQALSVPRPGQFCNLHVGPVQGPY